MKASILCLAYFMVQLLHPYMTMGKTIALTRQTFVGKVMSLLFTMLSRLVITFLPRSKRLFISWLLGAGVRHSAHGKGHEEGGSTYAKAGSSLRSPPGNSRASTPITRACLLYYFVLSPTPLTLRGAVPHHLFQRRS